MIGDGINDGPAVRAASCSGTPAAGRAFLAARTDFYLLTSGLAPVRRALFGAHALRGALRRNLGFAVFYNVIAVGVALSGHMSPLVAAVLMPLSSVASIALALRSLAPWRRGELGASLRLPKGPRRRSGRPLAVARPEPEPRGRAGRRIRRKEPNLDVVVLQVFVSLMLAVGSVLLFVHSAKQRDHEHASRLALLPLEAESG
jgi:hypothetical protein